jgi:hypothetical protein
MVDQDALSDADKPITVKKDSLVDPLGRKGTIVRFLEIFKEQLLDYHNF